MPELPEEMYCSQQICIPPAFPYLLRQYAKAAIRTQPTDLLKWSTAYFRCLALNLPPPVKPRLEYPIPLDYHGLTPGWLKALVCQLPNAQTVSFKLLWDRWVGACLKHNTLIEILLLGRFTDNMAIPWWRFIALCAGHLTENLTHTMIMVCEILTEEPEGGSAMISVQTFMDIYRFLADIDASKPQHLPNIHFTDSVLGLYEHEESEKSSVSVISSEKVVEISHIEEEKEHAAEEKQEEDTSAVVSCPDIAAEEKPDEPLDKTDFPPKGTEILPDQIDKTFELGKDIEEDDEKVYDEDEDDEGTEKKEIEEEGAVMDEAELKKEAGEKVSKEEKQPVSPGSPGEGEQRPEDQLTSYVDPSPEHEDTDQEVDQEAAERAESPLSPEEDDEMLDSNVPSEMSELDRKMEKETDETVEVKKSDAGEEGYQSVDTVQEDVEGRFPPKEKKQMPGQVPREGDEDEADALAATAGAGEESTDKDRTLDDLLTTEGGTVATKAASDEFSQYSYNEDIDEEYEGDMKKEDEPSDLPRYEWFDIPVVPGIGPTVPIELVEMVDEYMTKMAKIQHGVVMPRNIRHFACPPLEVFDFNEE